MSDALERGGPAVWTAAWKTLGGVKLKEGFASSAEAAMWLRMNVPTRDWVGVVEGDLDAIRKSLNVKGRPSPFQGGRLWISPRS